MATHVMADIETWSTQNNALLWAIGGVKFDGEQIIDKFLVGIDPVDCVRYGLHIDVGTILWWMDEKRDVARKRMIELPKVDLFAALDGFAMWVQQTPTEARGSLWGKGATFDNVKIKSAYDAVGLDYPFHYRADECYRTMANRFPDVEYVQLGVAHDPLDDAMSQAQHLIEIAKAHGIKL